MFIIKFNYTYNSATVLILFSNFLTEWRLVFEHLAHPFNKSEALKFLFFEVLLKFTLIKKCKIF
jgi:hypothetical protein